ncbi:hypothetical protein BYT27DRAFT_7232446 [Phlegmacium glaucopus]|nr:hypothetical protein BYT27DRAFT_7232446 [Phlegmacium glaucopus]
MIPSLLSSRQPPRKAWSREHLIRERAIGLGQAINKSTQKSYNSALNSYLSFVHLHDMPMDPSPETLSLFTVYIGYSHYEFNLPSHKADHFFEGNKIIVKQPPFSQINTLSYFKCYITNRDSLFPLSSPLWLMSDGSVPNHQFFISRLHSFFSRNIGGYSMRAGRATSLAKHGVPPSIIQPMGRWSSDTFIIYIRRNPVHIQALLYSQQHH